MFITFFKMSNQKKTKKNLDNSCFYQKRYFNEGKRLLIYFLNIYYLLYNIIPIQFNLGFGNYSYIKLTTFIECFIFYLKLFRVRNTRFYTVQIVFVSDVF